jgi:hypothetical protein
MQQAAMNAASGGLIAGMAKSGEGLDLTDLVPYQFGILPVSEADSFEAGVLGLGGMVIITGSKPGEPSADSAGPFGQGNPMGIFLLADPDAKIGDMIGRLMFEIDGGANAEEANRKMNDEMKNPEVLASLLEKDSPTEKEPPTDPRLTREVEIDKEIASTATSPDELSDTPENAGMTMALISKAIGVPVLLESFPRSLPPSLFIHPGKQPLYKVLIGLEKTGLNWELGDDALRVRPRDWALRRSYEIQESYLAYYKDLLDKQGMLTLDDVGKIALDLTDGQIGNTLLADPDLMWLSSVFGDFGDGKNLVRFYGSLRAQQKSTLRAAGGLPFSQLTTEQWDRLGSLISDTLGGVYVVDGSVKLSTDPKKAAAGIEVFEITVTIADEKDPRVFNKPLHLPNKDMIASMKKQRDEMAAARKKAAEEQKKTEASE